MSLFKTFWLLGALLASGALAKNGTLSGAGTNANPWLIEDYADLKKVGIGTYYQFGAYEQTADIDASASATENSGAGFVPIGNLTNKFTGSYNGKGHVINGLIINRPSTPDVGLFGFVGSGASVDSVGLVGGSVTGYTHVGGLVGRNRAGTVNASYSTGSVTGASCVGGLVGGNSEGTVSASYSTGSVTGSELVGGLVGENSTNCKVSASYSTGSVTGSVLVGGLVGFNSTNCIVSASYSTGSVTGSDIVGGLVGENTGGTVSASYSTGSVTGDSAVGGLLGVNDATVSASYWNTETSGTTIGIGADNSKQSATGLTTAQMQRFNNFTNWDFVLSWQILEGQSYPGNRSVDDAPFAFADTLHSTKTFDLKRLLANDYDVETSQTNLILHVDSLSAGTTDSTNSATLPVVDSLHIVYRVGEIRAAHGDTLWGNQAKSIVTQLVNFIFELASNSKTYGDAAFDLKATCTDESGVSLGGITYTSSDETLATINGSTVTILGAGEVSLIATSKFAAKDISQTLTIKKAPLTVTAKAETITLGETPKLAYSITSGKLFGTDKLTGALTANKTTVGKNDILQGTLSAGNNYDITYVPATLTVKAAATGLSQSQIMPLIDLGRLQGYDLKGRTK